MARGMASDEEMEAFEITEEDLLRRKLTKEDAIYGSGQNTRGPQLFRILSKALRISRNHCWNQQDS